MTDPAGPWAVAGAVVADAWRALHSASAAVPAGVWALVYALWIIGSVVYLLLQRRSPSATLAWLIGFLSLPLVGFLVYWFFGPRKLRRRRLRRQLAKRLAATLTPQASATMPRTLASRQWLGALARVGTSQGDAPPRPAHRVFLLDGGDATYARIAKAIRRARRQIHLEYYIFEPGDIGTRLRDLLVARARDGIAVRVVVDAIGSKRAGDRFWRTLVEAGGEVRRFNPPRPWRLAPSDINFRTHRKIVIVDGVHAFTGGINVSDGNSSLSAGSSAWRDTHLEIVGAPAIDLQVVFLEDWLFAGAEDTGWRQRDQALLDTPEDIGRWFPSIPAPSDDAPWVQIIDSGPDEATPDIQRFLFTAIASARRRLWITTPYFVPDESVLTALVTARARGVDVRLIVPERGDSRIVSAAASTFAEEAAAEGVAVYRYGPHMIHAKTLVVDDELAIVGTANLDNRSFRLNFEVIAAVYDTGLTARLAAQFERDLAHARPISPRETQPWMWRLLASAARLAAPLL
ncbi:MAG: cardiolipin synthase [Burkholderiaceae bacterium]